MKKMTFGFIVETSKDAIHIAMDEPGQQVHEVVITPHEVDTLVSMLQEAKEELLGKKSKTKSLKAR